MIYAILIISYLLDGIFSIIFKTTSFLLPVCSVISFIIIYPYFKGNLLKYLSFLVITGLFYDVGYGDIYLLNVIIFILVGLLIHLLYNLFSFNYFTLVLEIIGIVTSYRLVSYIIFILISNNSFSFMILFKSIYNSLILNVIYGLILYFISEKISNKYKILKKV